MKINIPIAIGNQIHQLQAKKEYYLFGAPVSPLFANRIIYRVDIQDKDNLKITSGITERIKSQHGAFLTQQANGKTWDIKYNIVLGDK